MAFINRYRVTAIIISAVLATAGIAFAMAVNQEKTYTWRYKITIEVNTPEGIKTGSSIREVTQIFIPTHDRDSRDPQYGVGQTMKGEAVVIDLEKRGKLFAVQSYDDYSLPYSVFKGPPGRTIEGAEYYSHLKATAKLEQHLYPKFVTFKEMSNPLSVELVYGSKATQKKDGPPYIFEDNFEKVFGSGVKLKEISIEMTNDPIIYRVKELLPWLHKYQNQLFDGKRIHTIEAENRLANTLGAGSFTTFYEETK